MRILDFADGFASSVEPTSVAFPANTVTNTPAGNLAATTIQGAVNELQGDIDTINAKVAAPSGIASLDSGGKIPSSQLPALAIIDINVVANIAARDALIVQKGDFALVTDAGSGVSKTYAYDGSVWREIFADGPLASHQASSSAHSAGSITNSPTGNLVATTVQAALNELQTDIDGRVPASTATTKGDLLVRTSSAIARVPVGTDGYVLKADSAQASGVAWGPNTVVSAAPTIQKFTSGSGTYTTPAGALYLRVRLVGGGSGGSGGGATSTMGAGGAGGDTTFGTTILVGNGASASGLNGSPGGGGSSSLGTATGTAAAGSIGSGGAFNNSSQMAPAGSPGAGSPFASGGGGGVAQGPAAGVAGTFGSGGGGGGTGNGVGGYGGGGGGSGGFVDAIITSPAASYPYAVGTGGAGGAAGTTGSAGGGGGAGYIEVTEYFQ